MVKNIGVGSHLNDFRFGDLKSHEQRDALRGEADVLDGR